MCLAGNYTGNECFSVAVRWNGVELGFDACVNSAQADGTGCSYDDFKSLMSGIWYNGYSASDLDEACN